MLSENQALLRDAIVAIPGYTGRFERGSKDTLYKLLYHGLSRNGEFLPFLFPAYDKSNFPKDYDSILSELDQSTAVDDDSKYFKAGHTDINPVHTGRPCSRKFKQGEAIYRCLDCGFDETCVLCSYCFNPADHPSHSVTVSVASASNEGICDCGDPEAWHTELHCKCNEKSLPKGHVVIDKKLEKAVEETIVVVLDYIIEVMIHQNHTIPRVHDSFKSSYNLETKVIDASNQSSFDEATDRNSTNYCLILWNDEFHNYPDATSRIQSVLNCDGQKAQEVATEVDREGRTILLESMDMDELVSAYYVVQRTGLTATIHSKRDVLKQEIVKYMVSWLDHLLNFRNVEFQAVARHIYCQVLTAKYDNTRVTAPYYLISSEFETNLEMRAFRDGLLTDDNRIPQGGLVEFAKAEYDIASLKNSLRKFLTDGKEPLTNSRLQYLLYFDIRFWKKVRKALHNVITPVLVADLSFKPIFASQFVEIYPHLINNMANLDREWLLNILNDVTVQLFTCPKTSLRLLKDGKLINILSPIIELFENNRSVITDSGDILWKKREIVSGADHHARAVWTTQRKSLRDVVQLIEHPSFTAEHLCLFETKNFVLLILFIKRFQSNWKIKRKEGEHVLRESTEFTTYFEFNSLVSELVKAVSHVVLKSYTTEDHMLTKPIENAIIILNNYLQLHHSKEKWIDQGDFDIIDFKVAKQDVGFMNPLNSLLSFLIEFAKVSDFSLLDKRVTAFTLETTQTNTSYSDFLRVSDISLRTLVLCSQIKMGFWVRNGVLVGRQETLYTSSLLAESGLFRDIHLQQVSIIAEPSLKRSLFNFLDRFDLLNWFLNNEDLAHSAYDEKVFYAFEEFIKFLYDIFTYRLSFKVELSEEEKEELKIRNLISYSLCLGPSAYSQLAENFANEAITHPRFEAILEELSEYKPPQGLSDTGLYRLKSSLFEKLDPLSMFTDSSNIPEATNAIKQELANMKKVKSDQIVLNPDIIKITDKKMFQSFKKINDFVKTTQFAKLLYKLLQTAIDTDNESFLPVLLHLIHAIILDEQFDEPNDSPLGAYNDIPIANLLLTISESTTIAKSNVKKADHVLDLFVLKDENVVQSLKDSFGEEHILSYKAMKAENGGGFETREEKKKRLAKERQEKIKRRFQKQQNKFAAKNQKILKSHADVDNEGDVNMEEGQDSKSSLRSCILCQMEESNTEIFGFPCYVNKSAVFWQIPTRDQAYTKLGLSDWSDQKLMDDTEVTYGKHIVEDINIKKRRRTNSHDSSAAHFSNDPVIYHVEEEDEDDDGVLDDELGSNFDGIQEENEDADPEPVEVIFDEQFIDDHGNILSQSPPGMQNYISSLNPSRRESFASDQNFSARFGDDVAKRYVASSCGHGMHYKCFKQYVRKADSFSIGFQCPLCRSLNNLFIPSFIRPQSAQSKDFKGEATANKYNKVVAESGGANSKLLTSELLTSEFLFYVHSPGSSVGQTLLADITQILKENEALEYIYSDATNFFANSQSLSILIGNTIQMNEMTSRLTTRSEDMNKIELQTSQSQLILSMIQFRSLIGSISHILVDPAIPLAAEYENLWQDRFLNVGIFTEFSMLIFQCNQSVQTLAKLSSTKLYTIVVDSLLERCSYNEEFRSLICIFGDEISDRSENLTSLKTLILEEMDPAREFSEEVLHLVVDYDPRAVRSLTNSFLVGLQYAIRRILLPFHRQLYILFTILNPQFKLDETQSGLSTQNLIKDQMSQVSKLVGFENSSDLPDILLVKSKELEHNVFENMLRSKIAKFLDEGSLTLDYPGVIKLLDLPSHLNKFLKMNEPTSNSGLQLQYSLCLLCGQQIQVKNYASLSHRIIRHFHKECTRSSGLLCILINPFNNILTVILQLQTTQSAISALRGRENSGKVFKYILPSPYLNKHGESNFRGGTFNGILNETRYNELNKLWLSQGIYAFLSRIAMDSRNLPTFTGVDPFTTGAFPAAGDDDDDDDGRGEPMVW